MHIITRDIQHQLAVKLQPIVTMHFFVMLMGIGAFNGETLYAQIGEQKGQRVVSTEIEVSPADVTVSQWKEGYDRVMWKGGGRSMSVPGHPDLPAQALSFAIHAAGKGIEVQTVVVEEELIGQGVLIAPVQAPAVIGQQSTFFPPDPVVYSVDAKTPGKPARLSGTHHMRGNTMVSVLYSPFRYNPVQKELYLIRKAVVTVVYEQGPDAGNAIAEGGRQRLFRPTRKNALFDNVFRREVINPEDVEDARDPTRELSSVRKKHSQAFSSTPQMLAPSDAIFYISQGNSLTTPETQSYVTYTVRRYGDVSAAQSVSYTTSNGTALAGTDYIGTNGTLNFSIGQYSTTFRVYLINDTDVDPGEYFYVQLKNPTGGATLDPIDWNWKETILDDDYPGGLKFVDSVYVAGEDCGAVTIYVSRNDGSKGAVSVQYATTNGTAMSGTDYTATTGTVSWTDGDMNVKSFTVPILNNSLANGYRSFSVGLSNPVGGAVLISPSSASVSIADVGEHEDPTDYLIITSDGLKPYFQKLAEHRSKQNGFSCKVMTVAQIYASYPGRDNPEKIRSCIYEYVKGAGASYVVLGGDDTVVPVRNCRATSIAGSNIPTDCYYSGLDGDWDDDGDGVYGEAEFDGGDWGSEGDLAADVMLGRIPVRTPDQAMAYINKVIRYETDPPWNLSKKFMVMGRKTWDTYSGTDRPSDVLNDGHLEFMAHDPVEDVEMWNRRDYRDYCLSNGWTASQLGVLHATLTSWDTSVPGNYAVNGPNMVTRMSEGWNFVEHYSHGATTSWTMESDQFEVSHAQSLTGAVNFLYTAACKSGGFHQGEPSLSEALLRNPNGGSLVFIGCVLSDMAFSDSPPANSSNGDPLGQIGPGLMRLWLKEVFANKQIEVGRAYLGHRAAWIPVADASGEDRWVFFGFALQGDPALKMIGVANEVSIRAVSSTCGEADVHTNAFVISRTGLPNTEPLVVHYTRSGTAGYGADYTTTPAISASGSMTIPAGSDTLLVTLHPLDDTTVESDETITLTVQSDADYTVNPSASAATISLVDNDNATVPTVTLEKIDNVAGEEGADPAVFRVVRTGSATAALVVNYSVSGTATNSDYMESLTGTISIPAGASSSDITITPVDDTLCEGDETVTLKLQTGAGYTLGASVSGTAMIVDNDAIVFLSVPDNTASEPGRTDGTGAITITRTGNNSASLTVSYTLSGTASNGVDYTTLAGTMTIPAGQYSADVTITPLNDETAEPTETAVLTLQSGAGYGVGSPFEATVNLYDDEPPTCFVSVSDSDCRESPVNGGAFKINRYGDLSPALTVGYTMSGTAISGTDYTAPGGSVNIAKNVASGTVTITPVNDTSSEGPEEVTLTITSVPSGTVIGSPASGTLIIVDNDLLLPEMDVQGNGVSIANADASPTVADNSDFGAVNVGTSSNRTFVIKNYGGASLSLSGSPRVALSGADAAHFSVTTQPSSSITSAGTNSFVIRFAPTSSGVKTTTVSISNNDADENPYSFVIQGTAITSYNTWLNEHGLSGANAAETADPDGDGIVNLLEYALGLEPLTANTAGLPAPVVESDHLTLTYKKWRSDVTYTVEVSGEPGGGWSNSGVTEVDLGGGNTKAIDPETISANTKRFIRLKVTQ